MPDTALKRPSRAWEFLKDFRQYPKSFMLNHAVPRNVKMLNRAIWIVGIGLLWVFSPFTVLPNPHEVLSAAVQMWQNEELWRDLGSSVLLILQAITATFFGSLFCAYLTRIPFFETPVTILGKLRYAPTAGLSFPFMLMFGGWTRLALLTFSLCVFLIPSMVDVIEGIPKINFDHARSLRMNEWMVTWQVIVRGTLDKAFDNLRNTAAMGWTMLYLVETLQPSGGGIGFKLFVHNHHSHLPQVWAIQVIIFLVGLLVQDVGLRIIRKVVCPHTKFGLERR